ncbi:protein FAM184A-like isoform X2 [Centruroides sculpturatus]|uniref:protein FAM184A-like isoform X2 n=1 Tax=Centruroides sculpturatus TaxID=218467 RepID=UPI000C6CF11A|nr:protein FAM184A-like isoform X2 [Centruroides sculpturatus]
MRIEDKDVLIMTMKSSHEEEIEKLLRDSKEKVTEYKEKMCQETEMKEKIKTLEDQLHEARSLLHKLSCAESVDIAKLEQPNKLSFLTERLETTKCDLQNILKEFEVLHKNLRSNLRIKSSCMKIENCADSEDKQTPPSGNIQFLRNLCDTLEKENTLLVQKYECLLNAIKTQYDEILLEVQKIKLQPLNNAANCQCNGTNFIKDLSNHETFFKKRLNELLLQLSENEEQSERHQKEINHLKEIIQIKVKETNDIREELERLKRNSLDYAEKYNSRTSQSGEIKSDDIESGENEGRKQLEFKTIGTNTDISFENNESELEFVQSSTQNIHIPIDLNEENFNKSHEDIINFAKCDSSKVTKEWRTKHKDAIKNYQTEMKRQTAFLNKLWRERLIAKEKELQEQSKKDISAAVNEIIIQKSREFENAQREWQNMVDRLEKQISQLESNQSVEENGTGDSKGFDMKNRRQYKMSEESEDRKEQKLFQEKLKSALLKQDTIYKEKMEDMKRQHWEELNAKDLAHKFTLEKLKLEKEYSLNEEKQKLQHIYQAHNSLEEQEKILLGEIKLMQTQLDAALQEIHVKDENAFQKERQLKKELALQKSEENKLHATIKILQSELSAINEELELKRNEVLCIRKEATHQIKNLESYWQSRLCKELRKLKQIHREEKQNMLNNFLKAQDLLKDKIFLLKNRLQSSDNLKNPKLRNENFENAKFWRKNMMENHSADFKLKDDKRTLSLELLNQDRNKSTVLDSTALLDIQKTVYERTILKPLCSPFLLRRNSAADPNQKRSKTQNGSSNKLGLRISDKRASWSGENIQSDILNQLQDLPNGHHKQESRGEEKASSCVDLPSMCSDSFTKPLSAMQPLSKHACDTIVECEEPRSLQESESSLSDPRAHYFQNDVTYSRKSDFCHKLPLLESEL